MIAFFNEQTHQKASRLSHKIGKTGHGQTAEGRFQQFNIPLPKPQSLSKAKISLPQVLRYTHHPVLPKLCKEAQATT